MSLRRVLYLALFPWLMVEAEGTGDAPETRKERGQSRRMRAPVRRNLPKPVQEDEALQDKAGKESGTGRNPVRTQRIRHDVKVQTVRQENERKSPEIKKEKSPIMQAQTDHTKPVSRSSKPKEKALSSERLMAAFRKAAEVSSWGNGVFTFQEASGKHQGMLIATSRTAFEPSFHIQSEFNDGLALVEDKN